MFGQCSLSKPGAALSNSLSTFRMNRLWLATIQNAPGAVHCPSSQSCPAVKSITSQGSRQSRSAITWLPCLTCFGSGSEPCFACFGRAAVWCSKISPFANNSPSFKRKQPRPRLGVVDKLFWVVARWFWAHWGKALLIAYGKKTHLRFQGMGVYPTEASCRFPLIVLQQTTQSFLATHNSVIPARPSIRQGEQQTVLLALVIALLVVMCHILLQSSAQRPLPEQDEFRQAFLFHRSHPAFRIGVQIRTPGW